jgi:membrane-bound lytic murein transglycosylase D
MKLASYLLAATLAVSVMAGTACQTARPAALLPPAQANAPALIPPPRQDPSPSAKLQQPDDPALAPKLDPVGVLIASVEKEYQSGQDNYKAGNLELARQSFDRAFDLLMGSPLDVHSDPRLVLEFDRVLAGLKSVDSASDQSSDNALVQKSEPAPIDEANEATPPVDPNVKAKAAAEVKFTRSDLPLMMTDPVAGYINYFSGRGRGVLERGLIRDGRYDAMIRRILKEEHVPQDLIYLAQAESGFHPLALSRAGARGMWQFMASRARGYGLERNQWVDERQDPEKATRAAARHLRDLYKQFGDWYLAMAAYNSGPGTVQQAVKRTGYVDFWELYKRDVLPKETRNYVPIILAVTIMAKNPEQYGLDKLVREQPVPSDAVKIDYPVDLRLVAECVGAPPATLQDLNPSLLRWTTPKTSPGDDASFELHLPAGTKGQFVTTISAIPRDMRVWWRLHKVVEGDTLAAIARSYRTSTQAIAQANDLEAKASLLPDSELIIPISQGRHASSEDAVTYARHITVYKVRRGDTVQSVAEDFNISPTMVRRWNHVRGQSLGGRRVLYIHLPVAPNALAKPLVASANPKSSNTLHAKGSKPVVRHKVAPGETLSSIASTHHTTVQALKRDNGVVTLRPGMILIIRASR